MKYKNAAYRAEEARAVEALHSIAALAGWQFAPADLLIPIYHDPYFYEPRANLLIVPGVEGWPVEITKAQRDLPLSAMLISIGKTNGRRPALYASVRQCVGGKIREHNCMRFWLGERNDLWLLTDPSAHDPKPVRARFHPSGLTIDTKGWWDEGELQAGLTRAHTLVP